MTTTEEAKNMRNNINIDDAGEIKLTLWGDDIPKINDGTKLKITNGYTNTFKGEVSLTKGKYGSLEVIS